MMFKFVVVSALVALATAIPQIHPHIVGGEGVNIEDYPYQLSLQYFGSHLCGASIISEKWVVTAAQCTEGSSANSLSVRAGSSKRGSGGVVVQVEKIFQNPQYNIANNDYDISVLELVNSLVFGSGVQPIALPTFNAVVPVISPANCSGWGTALDGHQPIQLQAVKFKILPQLVCKIAYYNSKITDRMVCADAQKGHKGTCQGDAGGPLAVNGKLIGIVSWGYGCARPKYPGLFSSVPHMRDFITNSAGV